MDKIYLAIFSLSKGPTSSATSISCLRTPKESVLYKNKEKLTVLPSGFLDPGAGNITVRITLRSNIGWRWVTTWRLLFTPSMLYTNMKINVSFYLNNWRQFSNCNSLARKTSNLWSISTSIKTSIQSLYISCQCLTNPTIHFTDANHTFTSETSLWQWSLWMHISIKYKLKYQLMSWYKH
jgi:hypothetical protein